VLALLTTLCGTGGATLWMVVSLYMASLALYHRDEYMVDLELVVYGFISMVLAAWTVPHLVAARRTGRFLVRECQVGAALGGVGLAAALVIGVVATGRVPWQLIGAALILLPVVEVALLVAGALRRATVRG
jgi:hypothetical protein